MSAQATTSAETVVTLDVVDGIGVIAMTRPPVNALGEALRSGLIDALTDLNGRDDVQAIVLHGEGRAFSAGADIREFGRPPSGPTLPDVLNLMLDGPKPVIAALHGVAMGGGLELALAAHVRVGVPGLRVALPEVKLGLLPGAGGTQRLPRLTGLAIAQAMILSGREVSAEEALSLGILDRIGSGAAREAGIAAAREVLAGKLSPRRTDDLTVAPDAEAMAAAQARLDAARPQLDAPCKALQALAAATGPITEGLALERRLFLELREGPERQALAHAFFAERGTARIPETDLPAREIASVGVIGGGTMGVGIATAFLLAGYPVRLIETEAARAEAAAAAIGRNLDGAVKRGKMSAEARAAAADALRAGCDMTTLADVDLVVEAVFEEMSVKIELMRRLDAICKPGAILGTNTSYLDVNEIAAATSRPEAVIGLHFFSPAHVMRLLEVVVADATAPDLVSTAFALARQLNKVPVRSRVCDGFIGNRILAHYRKSTEYVVLDGADFAQVDRALEEFGFAMGPFAVSDLAGLDIGMLTRRRKAATRPAEERYSRVADRICEQQWFGRKSGRGFYLHDGTEGRPQNPDALRILAEERAAEGISPRSFTDQEIVDRCMTAMISEAVRVLEEGIALRPADIDAVELFGYGFPRHLGGPMHYADSIGIANLVARVEAYADEDPHYWQVPELMRQMAREGRRFADLNGE
ncbi:MAG: 3-hydroxyacyl-CoA dehydrogenase [Rhodobacteraceae bacterium]|nr:3-hydroxyacyl-CoA dehydrogenase [Paracoccaceae bacterium]MBR9823597.1 3-hydroxyacyl-CoA dehydrogenase [Paracoccaceae bacterium]